MKKSKIVYKNSAKNEFAFNLLIVIISALITFMASKFFNDKTSIVVFAISIAVSYCKIAIESVEKILAKKLSLDIIPTLAILIIFASQKFLVAAVISSVYALLKSVYELINSFVSDKLIQDKKLMLSYTVAEENSEKVVLFEDICQGDLVKASRGDYLAFSYEFTNGSGLTKTYKPGKFNACESGVVTVLEIDKYDIDFEATYENLEKSKLDKRINFITLIYTIAAVLFAFVMFVMELSDSGIATALYTLGVYLLFASILSINSGNIAAGLLSYRALRLNGINVDNSQDIEDLSNAKDVFLSDDVVFDGDKIDANTVKALKTASVVKLNAYLIGSDEEKCEKAVKLAGFKDKKIANNNEEFKSILKASSQKNPIVCVCKNQCEDEKINNVVSFSCNSESERNIDKKDLFKLVREIKNCKIYKFFLYLRTAFGIAVNFLAITVFASGKLDSILSKKVIDAESVEVQTDSIMNSLFSCLVYQNKLAPWIIVVIHLILISVSLLIAQLLLNDDKKLR